MHERQAQTLAILRACNGKPYNINNVETQSTNRCHSRIRMTIAFQLKKGTSA